VLQLALASCIENDSAVVRSFGRMGAGSLDGSPIRIVIGPASACRVTILGLVPKTL
jgi:hypothetical protein